MDLAFLESPFEPAALADADTASLKSSLLKQVEARDADPMAQKVRFANNTLMPLFNELEKRNPTTELHQQIPLLKGVWFPVWSTNPFQDILPGRIHQESYQIFDDNGYYANLARYKPGRKRQILSWLSRWLLSYDLMIMQSYSVQTQEAGESAHSLASDQTNQQYWDIQNVSIQQSLRLGSTSFDARTAQAWFNKAASKHKNASKRQQQDHGPTQGANRIATKQYQQISKAKPRLNNLYIDQEFRLVKTQREKSQRSSYTVAVRLNPV